MLGGEILSEKVNLYFFTEKILSNYYIDTCMLKIYDK